MTSTGRHTLEGLRVSKSYQNTCPRYMTRALYSCSDHQHIPAVLDEMHVINYRELTLSHHSLPPIYHSGFVPPDQEIHDTIC